MGLTILLGGRLTVLPAGRELVPSGPAEGCPTAACHAELAPKGRSEAESKSRQGRLAPHLASEYNTRHDLSQTQISQINMA